MSGPNLDDTSYRPGYRTGYRTSYRTSYRTTGGAGPDVPKTTPLLIPRCIEAVFADLVVLFKM